MKTVVITGSARGLGFEMAKQFRTNHFNIVLSDINERNLEVSCKNLQEMPGSGKVITCLCNVTKREEVVKLMEFAKENFSEIDIFINNAGVNQPNKYAWELSPQEIDILLEVDLKGAINGTTVAINYMKEQGFGAIYNVEGFGSNDAFQDCLVAYGTAKRALTYYTEAVAHELKNTSSPLIIGRLSPGIMITDFITSQAGSDQLITLSDKVKKVYNILGDYPDVVASHLVKGMIKNKKNNAHIVWLTNRKAFMRFMKAPFSKRNFFN